jgi:predicted dehydrogenase
MPKRSNRRDFLKTTTAAGFGYWVAGGVAVAQSNSPNEQISFACIGVGGKGGSDSAHAAQNGNIVAICDVRESVMAGKAKEGGFEKAKQFTDFRKMLDEMEGSIDAVTVSTADHTHAVATANAIRRGKHVYCQKPLTHSIYEARTLGELAKQYKVITQMGNQGTALEGLRTAAKLIQDGTLGVVKEVHVWTNRPIWPQGVKVNRPKATPDTKGVDWDCFIGPAKERPYHPSYFGLGWRGYWDFGTGALGDMACHTMNMPFMALDLREPTSVEAGGEPHNKETYPRGASIKFEFPARGNRPALAVYWYEGKNEKGEAYRPPESVMMGQKVQGSGCLIMGEKGTLYSPNDYGAAFTLMPEKEFVGHEFAKFDKDGGDNDGRHFAEFATGIKEGKQPTSNFPDYAGPLTETILLGNLAIYSGKKIEWDAKNMKATNSPELDWIVEHEYRQGWTL